MVRWDDRAAPRAYQRVASNIRKRVMARMMRPDASSLGGLHMKAGHSLAGLTVLLLLTISAFAQDRYDPQLNEHDRQAAREWYNHHRNERYRGLRPDDRLTPELELRLQTGQPYDREWERRSYSVPRDLRRHLPPVPRGYTYVVVGHHVVLVDRHRRIIRDLIHLHD